MANYNGCLQLGFNPGVMDWKNEDYDQVVAGIKNHSPYVRLWNIYGKTVKKGQRVFVYYANQKKFIASGYVVSDETQVTTNNKGKKKYWASVAFDWVVDYEKENEGLKYPDLQDGKFKDDNGNSLKLNISLFDKINQIQGGCAFLKSEKELDILEQAWEKACPRYPGPNKSNMIDSSVLTKTEALAMSDNDVINEICELLKVKLQVIMTGAPGTGKTYLTSRIAARMLYRKNDPEYGDESAILSRMTDGQEPRYCFVQFHPGYDYSDFVQGLKPVPISGGVKFELTKGLFYNFCEQAENGNGLPYVMVIDEINRADLSRVFGELFYGLEANYRNRWFSTQYTYLKNEKFRIPNNVYIIGTMNDIDRSVESMDFALRRRFGWREITAEESQRMLNELIADNALRRKIIKVMNGINALITAGDKLDLEDSYKLGAAYFQNVKGDTEAEWNKLWNTSLKIILDDYRRTSRSRQAISKEDFDKLWK